MTTENEMTEHEGYIKMVVGKTLTNLFFTKQDGPHDYMPGISPAYYFATILELDNDKKFQFGNDFIIDWKDQEPTITLTNENWALPKTLVFQGQKIVNLTKDEHEQLTFHLENGTTIAHTIDYGDQLFIENEKVLDKEITVSDSTFLKAVQAWWQKLFCSE
ncbi:hypothetical protein [Flavobacterium suzhouense]|uniref:Uncharacterized protein n=1 Tax=Flavobacterium suzhouense TaxID=1529638 RepID=A0ABW5NWC8_9FLAO